ncbi:glycosyltransferase [Halapricum sp. CBA1109]|uniref:glycosyltransferase n=1 Tax=Halapricum sp. CBA1109 TaxID=2668068 RepID=UPI0012FA8D58|nr:glycosyltransferase [Halapricum sp. CBA1109]MUV88601.1 glycosyltransferase [Halapricum sp. CBA1109]
MSESVVIAHGGDVSQPSGGTNRVTAFAAGLAGDGRTVVLVVPTPEDELPDRLADVEVYPVDVPNTSVADQPVRAAAITWRARQIADRLDARLQFEHSTLGGIGELAGAEGYVLDMHDLAFESPLYGGLPFGKAVQRVIRTIESRAVQSADDVVVVSENMRRLVADAFDVAATEITVVPNGYFSEKVDPYADVDTVPGRVAFLGTLHPKLDVEAIVGIADLPEVEEVVVVGDGANRERLAEVAADDQTLRVTGRLPDEEAFELVASAAVAINPQHQSDLQRASSPVKIYYYAALGSAMVLSTGPAVAEELQESGAAVVVDDDKSFPNAVQCLLRDDDRRASMAAAASTEAEQLSWESRVADLRALY